MEFDVTVENPKGTHNKYVTDRESGRIRLDRTLFTATQYPADYGFVENTIGEDTDPLDALVLVHEPTFPGCLIRCRAIGLFLMDDDKGPDPTVICVPTTELRLANLIDIDDMEHFHRLEIQHFFEIYTDLEPGKRVNTEAGSWSGRSQAEAEIERSRQRNAETMTAVHAPGAPPAIAEYA